MMAKIVMRQQGPALMSSIVSGIDYSVLFASSLSPSDASAGILNALQAGSSGSSSTAVSTGSPLTDLKLAQKNQTADIAKEAKDPSVARDIAAFKKGVANAKDIATALSNPNVLKVLLTANGLGSQAQYPGLAKKVLLSDPADKKSLVNQLGSSTWLATVKTYDFAKNGLAELKNPKVQSALANGYAEVMWRQSLDKATPGLSNALAFINQAKSVKTVDDILGDPVNRAVVTTALGIPQQIAFQNLTAQEHAVSTRLDVKKLQDPKFVTSLTDQYLLIMQQNARASAGNGAGLFSLAVQARSLVV
jgi:hypothetical protein